MLSILGPGKTTCDGVTRRDLLKVGGLALFGGLTLPQPARANRTAGRVRSVILIDLFGGPSQIDTFDPKPEAPEEIRGEFASIASALPGVAVTEHVPRLA